MIYERKIDLSGKYYIKEGDLASERDVLSYMDPNICNF